MARPVCKLVGDSGDIFVVLDDVKIAQRGYPDTPQAKTWVSLEPGYAVLDDADMMGITIEYNGTPIH
jgi:hypothetical protein